MTFQTRIQPSVCKSGFLCGLVSRTSVSPFSLLGRLGSERGDQGPPQDTQEKQQNNRTGNEKTETDFDKSLVKKCACKHFSPVSSLPLSFALFSKWGRPGAIEHTSGRHRSKGPSEYTPSPLRHPAFDRPAAGRFLSSPPPGDDIMDPRVISWKAFSYDIMLWLQWGAFFWAKIS